MTKLCIVDRPVGELVSSRNQARFHSKKQVRQIAKSIEKFGFTNPVLISDDDVIVAGHGRVAAAKLLGLKEVPTVRLALLSEADRRAYALADNKLALDAEWDREILAIELQKLIDLDYEIDLTGFSIAEADFVIDSAAKASPAPARADRLPELTGPVVSRPGDLWQLGRHRLICGDAREPAVLEQLLQGEKVDMIFTDPPYNVVIDDNVCGSGQVKHREFAMASGEMSAPEFVAFLKQTVGLAAASARDGAIAFIFMDWRHIMEMLEAGNAVFDEFKNVCVWNKSNAGMGTFYRSKHELIFVFKKGSAPHTNNFGLGDTGRYRTNVWDYPGISSFSSTRSDELAMHPTVKPVALVTDAILDCSKRGEVILDCFGGSGTTLIAAEQSGRTARLIEFDPAYCEVIVKRFEQVAGKPAILIENGDPGADGSLHPSLNQRVA